MIIRHASISGYLKRTLFTTPYPLLPLAVFAFLAFSFIYHPQSAFHKFSLYSTDDYMRLNQVVNWVQGNGWYDLSHPRLNPSDGTEVRWSRLVDLPLAAIAWPLSRFLELKDAAMIAALIVPLLLLGGFLLPVVTFLARPLVPKYRANMAAVMLMFALPVVTNFAPGRVDHHGYQLAIAGLGFACFYRMWLCARGWRSAIIAAFAFACGLWIGGEIVPSLAVFGACLAVLAGWQGGKVLKNAAVFGACLPAFSAVILLIAKNPHKWAMMEITWFSLAYVVFASFMGGVFVLGWILGRKADNRYLRMALMIALSFMAAMAFFYFVPEAVQGPYANMEVFSSAIVLNNVSEAKPLLGWFSFIDGNKLTSVLRLTQVVFVLLFFPTVGLIVATRNMLVLRGRRQVLWAIICASILPFMLLAMFWQKRVLPFCFIFSIAPITWLLWKWLDRIEKTLTGRPRFWAEVFAFCALGAFPAVVLPATLSKQPLFPDVALFPASHFKEGQCNMDYVAAYLSGDETPRVIMSTMNEGPALLFKTPHKVLSAPYNVRGNRDSLDFFSSRDDATAQNILRRRGVDLVLVCRHVSAFYATINKETRWKASLSTGADGNLNILSDKNRPTLIEKLIRENNPGWLKPVEVALNKDYLLYEVELPKDQNDKK